MTGLYHDAPASISGGITWQNTKWILQINPRKNAMRLKGKVLQLKDLVNYNEGTVASRMIVSRKAGNITIFSFDENEGLY